MKDEEDRVSTYYIRDASGNPMAIYERSFAPGASGGSFTATLALEEWPMYASARLGSATDHGRSYVQGFTASYTNGPTNAAGQVEQVFNQATIAYPTSGTATGAAEEPWLHTLGHKRYELNDHLGNVKATISDRRYAEGSGSFDHFAGVVVSSQDYYPYGMPLPARLANMSDHRYAFQGQEQDNDVQGSEGTSYAFKYRMYNSRIGRFLTTDPLSLRYPWNSSYAFSENEVVDAVELEGLEKVRFGTAYSSGGIDWSEVVDMSNMNYGQVSETLAKYESITHGNISPKEIWGHRDHDDEYWTIVDAHDTYCRSLRTHIEKFATLMSYKDGDGKPYWADSRHSVSQWLNDWDDHLDGPKGRAAGVQLMMATWGMILTGGTLALAEGGAWASIANATPIYRALTITEIVLSVDGMTTGTDNNTLLKELARKIGGERGGEAFEIVSMTMQLRSIAKGIVGLTVRLKDGTAYEAEWESLNGLFTTFDLVRSVVQSAGKSSLEESGEQNTTTAPQRPIKP